MTNLDIHELDLRQLEQAYRAQDLTALEVCEHLLGRIEDPGINCNAFAYVARDSALEAARASTQRWREGRALGPLDGIPVAIKDVLDVAGMPTRYGSAACAEAAAAARDSLVAKRLRDAGAVLLGKTRTWEFAWRANVDRDPAEVVRNPHDPQRSVGGSSSGSAAAVAAGLCPLSIGTDSGGSVRGPAAFCGIVGFKPSHALIPVYPPSPMGELEHIGILARSVADVRIALEHVAGRHADDPASWPFDPPLREDVPDIGRLRFGFSGDLDYGEPVEELRQQFNKQIDRLADSGLDLRASDSPLPADFDRCYDLFVPDAVLTLQLVPEDRRHLVDTLIVELAQQAQRMTVEDFTRVEALRDEIRRGFAHLFENIDCLLTPTQEILPNRLDEPPGLMRLTRCFNVTGQPAISIPAGISSTGLPVGLQLVCDLGRDAQLLTIAERIAGLLDGT